MPKTKRKPNSFGDGLLDVYGPEVPTNEFGARENPGVSGRQHRGKLWFRECSIRQQDMEAAIQQGYDLKLKVAVHRVGWLDASCMLVVNGLAYGIAHLDASDPYAMYAYLEGGYAIG